MSQTHRRLSLHEPIFRDRDSLGNLPEILHIFFWFRSTWSRHVSLCCCFLVTKLRPTLLNPMDCSPPASSVHGICRARIPEWAAISFSRGSFWPRDWTHVSCIGRWNLYCWATREAQSQAQMFALQMSVVWFSDQIQILFCSLVSFFPFLFHWFIQSILF